MNIIIFGLGKIYRKYIDGIKKQDKIIAYTDNNKELQGKYINGNKIISPEDIYKLPYDKIVIMSSYTSEIKKQLLQLGIKDENILYGKQYIYMNKQYFLVDKIRFTKRKRVLIVTSNLGYHGGSMACIFLADGLQKQGYLVTIIASFANKEFIKEYSGNGYCFQIMEGIEYAKIDNIKWISEFDLVIANTYPMILFALEISDKVKTILWLHESKNVYAEMNFWISNIKQKIINSKLRIFAVSEMARDNFCEEIGYPKDQVTILEYGIPSVLDRQKINRNKAVTFAVIGTIYSFKQQKLFIDAIELLNEQQRKYNNFWIIGKIADQEYAAKILKQIENKPYIKFFGEKSQKELSRLYDAIDIIVVCSKQESLPIVAVEAFMRRKPCIVCENTGISQYISNKVNGYIYKTNDVGELARAMKYFIDNKNVIEKVGESSRKIYEERFSFEKFRIRLQKKIDLLDNV